MSHDVYLLDPVSGEPLQLDSPHQMKGGTYALGGCLEAHLNVTYNYSEHFQVTTIYGLTGADSIPVLQAAADRLGDDVDPDYWKPTEGNVKRAILQLLALAKMRPDGVWGGD